MKTKILIVLMGIIIIASGGFAIWYSQTPRCPESCDDGNPCTQDFCSSETDYQCKHSPIVGFTEGCKGSAETCKQYQCVEGECQIVTLPDCCGNKICEVNETYESCPADCPNCNDNNGCTIDSYDYHQQKCVNEIIIHCCGNGICDEGLETYFNCSTDCPNCNDNNKCTIDSYDYHQQNCVHMIFTPCCGNGICDEGVETYSNCLTDCPNCDDDNKLTGDSFNYTTQKCEHITYYFFEDFNDFDEGAAWISGREWIVIFPEDETNGMLTVIGGKNGGFTAFGGKNWTDYTFYLKVGLREAGAVGFAHVRINPEGAYFLGIFGNRLVLNKVAEKTDIKLEAKECSFGLTQFHDVKIEAKGNNIKVYVDNNLEINYTDEDNPFLAGRVGLEAIKKVYFDDIIVEASR